VAVFLELPGIQATVRGQAQIDAVVTDQVLRPLRLRPRKYDGAPTTAMRMSGSMRTAIMSFATCSPARTLASKRWAAILVSP